MAKMQYKSSVQGASSGGSASAGGGSGGATYKGAISDPFQQPALANAMMIGKTFAQMAPPGGSRPAEAGGGPAFPAQRGEGFQTPPKKLGSTKGISGVSGKVEGITASPFGNAAPLGPAGRPAQGGY